MLKVLLFSNLYPTPQVPTRGIFNLHSFQALSRYCETRIVVPLSWWTRGKRPRSWVRCQENTSTGITAYYSPYFSLPGQQALHARGMYSSLRPLMRRLHREFPFDVILASWAYPDAAAAAHFAKEFGCPLVSMIMGSDLNELTRFPSLRIQIRSALEASERVICVSGALKERAVELGIDADKVIVQHNGVDGERFRIRPPEEIKDLRERLGLPLDRPVICYVGNFKPEKGVEVLIEAMGELNRRGRTEILLALVGSGPLEEGMRDRVKRLGIEDQVRFCGRRTHEEIPDWMAVGDLFCLPSFREGCPNVILEALASGKPVVASAVGGVPELIRDGDNGNPVDEPRNNERDEESKVWLRANGVLVPSGDPSALASGVELALSRDWNSDVQRSTVEFLSWNDFGQVLHETLRTVVQERKAE